MVMNPIKSFLPGVVWPAVPDGHGARLLSLLWQFAQTERWPVERLLQHQLRQLGLVIDHALFTVPFYGKRLARAGYRGGAVMNLEQLRALPLLTRRDIQDAGAGLHSTMLPPQFGEKQEFRTSGSTGQPVMVLRTAVDNLIWQANTLRDHYWHQRDQSLTLAAIRKFAAGVVVPADGAVLHGWGSASDAVRVTGHSAVFNVGSNVNAQADWLKKIAPGYLLTYPSNLQALLTHFDEHGETLPGLRAVLTVAETVGSELRSSCRRVLGVDIEDVYSTQEFGYLALQCPVSGQYHVMAESALVEVLDSSGNPCKAGDTGRLVVSSLHNFAMPLIRYELGDYAVVGDPCPCGRTLPTLARIAGRERNMVRLPDGGMHWPVLTRVHRCREIAPVRQFQLIQHDLRNAEARLVCDRALTADEESRLSAVFREALGHPFEIRFTYYEGELPRGPNGKLEEVLSLVG
jgi:phenylacetate-CoA ligase